MYAGFLVPRLSSRLLLLIRAHDYLTNNSSKPRSAKHMKWDSGNVRGSPAKRNQPNIQSCCGRLRKPCNSSLLACQALHRDAEKRSILSEGALLGRRACPQDNEVTPDVAQNTSGCRSRVPDAIAQRGLCDLSAMKSLSSKLTA